jgi:hypothetical protein
VTPSPAGHWTEAAAAGGDSASGIRGIGGGRIFARNKKDKKGFICKLLDRDQN